MDNLPELRDIHLPGYDVSIFPLARGWWFLLALLVGGWIFIKVFRILRRQSAKLYARKLMQQLQDRNDLQTAVEISEILRRICLRKYPTAACLSDNAWIEFLNQKSSFKLNETAADLLKKAPFLPAQNQSVEKKELDQIKQFCQHWIGENL